MGTPLLCLHSFIVIAPLSPGIYYGASCSGKHGRMTSFISYSKCLRSSLSLKFNYLSHYRWLWISFPKLGWVLSISENSTLSYFRKNSHNFVVNFCPYLLIFYFCHRHHFSLNWVFLLSFNDNSKIYNDTNCWYTVTGKETVHFL